MICRTFNMGKKNKVEVANHSTVETTNCAVDYVSSTFSNAEATECVRFKPSTHKRDKKHKNHNTVELMQHFTTSDVFDSGLSVEQKTKRKEKLVGINVSTNGLKTCEPANSLVDPGNASATEEGCAQSQKKRKHHRMMNNQLQPETGMVDENQAEPEMCNKRAHHSRHKHRARHISELDDTKQTSLCDVVMEAVPDTVDPIVEGANKKRKHSKHRSDSEAGDKGSTKTDASCTAGKMELTVCSTEIKKRKRHRKNNMDYDNTAAHVSILSPSVEIVNKMHSVSKLKHKKRKHEINEEPASAVSADMDLRDLSGKAAERKSKKVKKTDIVLDDSLIKDSCEIDKTHKQKKKKKTKDKHTPTVSDRLEVGGTAVEQPIHGDFVTAEPIASLIKKQQIGDVKEKQKKKQKDDASATAAPIPSLNAASNQAETSRLYQVEDGQPSKLGQWKDVTFDAPERQHKFLRLLGGMKTSAATTSGHQKLSLLSRCNQLSRVQLSPAAPSSIAMSAVQQDQLDRTLEEQFEKAREFAFKKQKGIGLGFEQAPGAGKTVYIDTTSVRSKQFDD